MIKKILVVDDDISILETLKIILETEGYQLFTADNGQTGLELAEKYFPDLIILDIKMPKMSGHLFASILQQNTKLKETPVILLTGTALIAGGVTLEVPGVKARLSKPFDHTRLFTLIKRLEKEKSKQTEKASQDF
tara:strand:- start:323 stop:727 length:405 start_codon:yes stop_codon:yes gene_type:complete